MQDSTGGLENQCPKIFLSIIFLSVIKIQYSIEKLKTHAGKYFGQY
jgi:hypothetical protein